MSSETYPPTFPQRTKTGSGKPVNTNVRIKPRDLHVLGRPMRNTEKQNRNLPLRSWQSKGRVTQKLVDRYFNNIAQEKDYSQSFDES